MKQRYQCLVMEEKRRKRIVVCAFTVISLLFIPGILHAEENYVKNGDFEQAKDNKLAFWKLTGRVKPEEVSGAWHRLTCKFNSGDRSNVVFFFFVYKGTIGRIWIDNITCPNAQIKNASFEEEDSNGHPMYWKQDSKRTVSFDTRLSANGRQSVRIAHKNEAVPQTRLWQSLTVEPNKEYSLSFDAYFLDDFQGEARGLIFDDSEKNCIMSNYGETDISKLLEARDRCGKYAAILMPTKTEPAEISQEIEVKHGMNYHVSADINNKTLKGKVRFVARDLVSGEILKESEVKEFKDKWQTWQKLFQSKSSKIGIGIIAEGEGIVHVDNVAVTPLRVIPFLQEVQWLPASKNFSIPPELGIYIQGQSGKAIDGGVELLSNDLKNYGVALAKTGLEKASLQLFIGVDYAVKGKESESYTLMVNQKGITIKAGEEPGAFYGLMTLLQLIKKQEDRLIALACDITDYPDMPMRGVLYGDPEQAARWKMNTFMISTGYPVSPEDKEYIRKLVLKCEKLNLKMIPYFLSLEGGYYVQKENPNLAAGIWVKDEQLTLRGAEPSPLLNRYVIRTRLTDVKLKSLDGKESYVLGKDYQVINGDMAYNYNNPNAKPFAVARLPGSSISDGSTVLASYDYVSHYRSSTGRDEEHIAYCPLEPEVRKLMGDFMRDLARDYSFPYINTSHCLLEFRPAESHLETDSRIINSGKKPIDLLAEDVCFLDTAAKQGNPKVRILQWAGNVVNYVKAAGTHLPKDALINIWGYDANWPATYGREAVEYWTKLGFETSVMSWDNLRNVREWAQVVAEARQKGYRCVGMIDSCWYKRYGGMEETAIVSWKIPKEGERGFVSLSDTGM